MPSQWVDYDPQKRQFVKPPTLPLPVKKTEARPPSKPREAPRTPALPANGAELQQRLNAYDAQLARQGLCKAGELVKHVVQTGVKAGYEADLAAWSGPAIALAVEATRTFEGRLRQASNGRKEVA
jgi:hypothetical protein